MDGLAKLESQRLTELRESLGTEPQRMSMDYARTTFRFASRSVLQIACRKQVFSEMSDIS